jgi:excisionase family DNA binding protein
MSVHPVVTIASASEEAHFTPQGAMLERGSEGDLRPFLEAGGRLREFLVWCPLAAVDIVNVSPRRCPMSESVKRMMIDRTERVEAPESFLTIDEVAQLLRVPVLTVRWLRQEGRFAPAVRVGRRLVWDRRDLDEWVDRQRESTVA